MKQFRRFFSVTGRLPRLPVREKVDDVEKEEKVAPTSVEEVREKPAKKRRSGGGITPEGAARREAARRATDRYPPRESIHDLADDEEIRGIKEKVVAAAPEEKHLSVYAPLDSWEKAGPAKDGESKGRSYLGSKGRRKSMGISVSEEEADLLHAVAMANGESFSSWARRILFREALGREMKRPVGANGHPKKLDK